MQSAVDDAAGSGTKGAVTAASSIAATLSTMGTQIGSAASKLQQADAKGELEQGFQDAPACKSLERASASPVAAAAHARDEHGDHRHEVQLAEQRLDDRQRPAELAGRRVVAVPERRERDEAEVEPQRAGPVGSLGEEVARAQRPRSRRRGRRTGARSVRRRRPLPSRP